MSKLAILIPVLGRARLIAPLYENIEATTLSEHRTLFICSPGDDEATEACRATGAETVVVDWRPGPADFQRKINFGYRMTEEPWLFQGATDLVFRRSWDVRALRLGEAGRIGVIGTNDLGNPLVIRGRHATHILFSRAYIERFGGTPDGTGEVFCELYDHSFCDTEFITVASARGQFRSCRQSVVEHMHPNWHKAEPDEIYAKADRQFKRDAQLYQRRLRALRDPRRRGRIRV